MAGIELKIEDTYITAMAEYLKNRGDSLQGGIDSYLTILSSIRDEALTEGETAEALSVFITYGEALKTIISGLGENAKITCNNFLIEVDEKDQFLFEKGV